MENLMRSELRRILYKAGIRSHHPQDTGEADGRSIKRDGSVLQAARTRFSHMLPQNHAFSPSRIKYFVYGVLSAIMVITLCYLLVIYRQALIDLLDYTDIVHKSGIHICNIAVSSVITACIIITICSVPKRIFDCVVSLIMLVLVSPILLAAMVMVRLTSTGPIIYTQRRLGVRGKIFTIFKLRTMYRDSEPNGDRWCVPGDPRVTPVGRLLRFTHVDELPQLLNVLHGDMSLVGPRPERPEIVAHLERCFPAYRNRLLVRPGLTGLAQVLGGGIDRNLAGVHRRLCYDLWYTAHVSPLLDLRIMLGTLLFLLAVPVDLIARVLRLPDIIGDIQTDMPQMAESYPEETQARVYEGIVSQCKLL